MNGHDGSGFLRCSDGHMRWGLFGAAGVVFVVFGTDGPRVMLQKRSAFAHEGGTWSCAGGAIDEFETPLDGAMREACEEVGVVPTPWEVIGETVFAPADDWRYTTYVVQVNETFGESMNFETDAVAWATPAEVDALELHPGFAASWPELRAIIDSVAASSGGGSSGDGSGVD